MGSWSLGVLPARSSLQRTRQVWLGGRLRHLLVFRSKGGTHRDPLDPAADGFAATARGDGGFLDLGLSGHRRLRIAAKRDAPVRNYLPDKFPKIMSVPQNTVRLFNERRCFARKT